MHGKTNESSVDFLIACYRILESMHGLIILFRSEESLYLSLHFAFFGTILIASFKEKYSVPGNEVCATRKLSV